MIVILYLLAVVAANTSVTLFGPTFAIINSFVFIAFDLASRDALHERWQGRALWPRMLALIAAGGVLSVLLNANALPIAVASCAAFVAAGLVDAGIYQLLFKYPKLKKMNASNFVSAWIDSLVFVGLAFGAPILWGVVFQAWLAKVAGGLFWSLVIVNVQQWASRQQFASKAKG